MEIKKKERPMASDDIATKVLPQGIDPLGLLEDSGSKAEWISLVKTEKIHPP